MFPLRIELRTFRVLSGCDNHYTTETVVFIADIKLLCRFIGAYYGRFYGQWLKMNKLCKNHNVADNIHIIMSKLTLKSQSAQL